MLIWRASSPRCRSPFSCAGSEATSLPPISTSSRFSSYDGCFGSTLAIVDDVGLGEREGKASRKGIGGAPSDRVRQVFFPPAKGVDTAVTASDNESGAETRSAGQGTRQLRLPLASRTYPLCERRAGCGVTHDGGALCCGASSGAHHERTNALRGCELRAPDCRWRLWRPARGRCSCDGRGPHISVRRVTMYVGQAAPLYDQ